MNIEDTIHAVAHLGDPLRKSTIRNSIIIKIRNLEILKHSRLIRAENSSMKKL